MDERCHICNAPTPSHTGTCPKFSGRELVLKQQEIVTQNEVQTKQTEALIVLGNAVQSIANFLTSGGLTNVLSGYARSQAVKDILGGLATHDGRDSLDGRVLKQNALEIVTAVEAVFEKYQEKLSAKGKEDPEIKDSQLTEFEEWKKKNEIAS